MRLKAPEGRGNPVVDGREIEPKKGLYEVDAKTGKHLVESFGYIDIDAPPKPAVIAATPKGTAALRDGALASLKHLGVGVPADFSDERVAGALVEAVKAHVDGMAATVKAAEDRVLNELANKKTGA
jgi:hypothetical protein